MNAPLKIQFRLAEDGPAGKAGEVVLLAVTPADTNSQQEVLDTYLGGYSGFGLAADVVLSPIVLVEKEVAQRRDHSKENAFEVVDPRTGRHGAINEIDHKSALTAYKTEEFALAAFVPFAAENDADAVYQVRAETGEMIGDKLGLDREVRVITDLTTLTNWNAANRTTLLAAGQWDTGVSSDPRADLFRRIKASAGAVTDVAMNPEVAFYFLGHTKVRDYMKQMLGDGAPNPDIAAAASTKGLTSFQVPGLPRIWICPGMRLNATTGVLEYIMADDVVLLSNPPSGRNNKRIATHRTFRTRGRSGSGVTTNEYIPNGRGLEGGTMFEMGFKETIFFPSNIVGGLIKDVLSTV